MRIIDFLDNRFQEVMHEGAKRQALGAKFSSFNDAEANALKGTLTVYRWALAVCMVPKVFGHYVLVLTGLAKRPEPALVHAANQVKEMEEIERLKKQGKKVGFNNVTKLSAHQEPGLEPA